MNTLFDPATAKLDPPTIHGDNWTRLAMIGDVREGAPNYRFFADTRGNYWITRADEDDPQPMMFTRAELASIVEQGVEILKLNVMNPPDQWGWAPVCRCEGETPAAVTCDECSECIDFKDWHDA